jgi:hypothetical protein
VAVVLFASILIGNMWSLPAMSEELEQLLKNLKLRRMPEIYEELGNLLLVQS